MTLSLLLAFLFSAIAAAATSSPSDFDQWLLRMHDSSSPPNSQPFLQSLDSFPPSSKITTIIVALDGSGNTSSVQHAVDLVPKHNKNRVVIFIKRGIYREKVLINKTKPYITFEGEGSHLTHIEWNDTASTIGRNGSVLKTYGSATVGISASNFIAKHISFKNSAPPPTAGSPLQQAVALRITGDRAQFYDVHFYGAQDTLYDKAGRHYFRRCYIQGSIDFIFGNGRSLYDSCHLHSIASPYGSLTAQKRMFPDEKTGFSFVNSVVTGSGNVYLGRAWGNYSRVVYSYTYFDDLITPQAWFNWANPERNKTVYYGEYECYGPGLNVKEWANFSRVLSAKEARPFLSVGFINGEKWLDQS